MNPIRNQKGLALVSTLLMCVLGFAVVAIMLRLATQETKLAALERGYTTSLDAAKAGTDLLIDMLESRSPNTPPVNPPGPANSFGQSSNLGHCLNMKMNNPTSGWYTATDSGTSWTGWLCPSQASGNATSTDPTAGTDVTLTLANYTVYIKVIDSFFAQSIGSAPCQNGCWYYTAVARAQAAGSKEHADVFFVYRWGP